MELVIKKGCGHKKGMVLSLVQGTLTGNMKLVNWCFQPSQPLRIIPGYNTKGRFLKQWSLIKRRMVSHQARLSSGVALYMYLKLYPSL